MKILLLADEPDTRLWDDLDRKLLEGVDLVISCGDLPASYLSFLTCFTTAPILYVHGNHDERYDVEEPEGCVCLEDRIYVFRGLRILGLGGSMRYRPGTHQYTEREMQARVRKLAFRLKRAGGFDLLVTHAPARGVGDEEHISHRGFAAFTALMDRWKPLYMVHGHMHRDYTSRFVRERQYGDTKVVNAWKRWYIEINDEVIARRRETWDRNYRKRKDREGET